MHPIALAQQCRQLDVRLHEVKAEQRRAEVQARHDRREVVALEREVLRRVHDVAIRVEDRGDVHAEERVRAVDDVRVLERRGEPEVRDVVALLRVRDLEEAGEHGVVGRVEALGRLDNDEDRLSRTGPEGERGREELDRRSVGREGDGTSCGDALQYNVSDSFKLADTMN